MSLTYRHQKRAPLTSDEIDGNFEELLRRIEILEQTPAFAEGIGKIEQKGDVVEMIGSHGTSLGSFKLPVLTYTLRGKWAPDTSYAAYDAVAREAQAWVCVIAHTSTDHFEDENWSVLLDVSEMLKY